MLKALGIVAVVIAIVVAGIVAYAATRPDTFEVSRSLAIKASPEKLFPMIDDLRTFNSWNPFAQQDPQAKVAYRGPAAGKGAAYAWDGNSNAGKGSVEITESSPASKVVMRLDMERPLEAHNRVELTLVPRGDETTVTWAMRGPQPLLGKIVSVFIDLDKMVGGQFEKGVATLKAAAER